MSVQVPGQTDGRIGYPKPSYELKTRRCGSLPDTIRFPPDDRRNLYHASLLPVNDMMPWFV
jgi:hypothetical protein